MKKIIVSGDIIEFYDYEKTLKGKGGYKMTDDIKQKEKNYNSTVINRRNNVRRLVTSNFEPRMCNFLTLTFAKNMTDLKFANNEFKKFIKRLKYQFKIQNLKYVCVIEFQKRGAIHYHVIINTPWIPLKDIEKCWGLGFVFIENIDNCDNLGAYLVKYMTKENADKRLEGEKGYLCSRNLVHPIEYSDFEYLDLFKTQEENILNKIKGHPPIYSSTFDTEFLGKCHYEQYNLKRS